MQNVKKLSGLTLRVVHVKHVEKHYIYSCINLLMVNGVVGLGME